MAIRNPRGTRWLFGTPWLFGTRTARLRFGGGRRPPRPCGRQAQPGLGPAAANKILYGFIFFNRFLLIAADRHRRGLVRPWPSVTTPPGREKTARTAASRECGRDSDHAMYGTRIRDSDVRLGCLTRMYDSDVRLGWPGRPARLSRGRRAARRRRASA